MQVRPQHGAVYTLYRVEQVMVVIPVDGQKHETENVSEESRSEWIERFQRVAMRRPKLQNHDGNNDRVTECFQSPLGHHGLPG